MTKLIQGKLKTLVHCTKDNHTLNHFYWSPSHTRVSTSNSKMMKGCRYASLSSFLLQKMKSFVWLLSLLCSCVSAAAVHTHHKKKLFFFFHRNVWFFLRKHQISFVTKKWACKQRAAVLLCERHGSKHKGDCSCVVSRLYCRHKNSDRVKTSLSRYVSWKAIKS